MNNVDLDKIDGDKFRFVLSPGRVGTTSLREYLKENVSNLEVAFEPKSSRRAFMLWNMERYFQCQHSISESYVLRQRMKDYQRIEKGFTRIEINPFITPFCNVLSENIENMQVVHIVRHPYTWINSIISFRALGWHKYVIDHVPFTRMRHPLVKETWSTLTEAEKFAWRWRLHNEQILESVNNYSNYKLVKYEDLSLGNEEIKLKSLSEVMEVLLPEHDASCINIKRLGKFNTSSSTKKPAFDNLPKNIRENIHQICEHLMTVFAYSDEI